MNLYLGGWPIPAPPVQPDPPVLYETSLDEKVEAGIILKHAVSTQDAWERLEKRGYTLARRTKPEVKKA